MNHRGQAKQENALQYHGTQWVVKSPNSPHGESPK
jgi:hypothetical protein